MSAGRPWTSSVLATTHNCAKSLARRLACSVLTAASMWKTIAVFTLAVTACTETDGPVHRTLTDPLTGAEFDVEVRYAGGLTAADAEAMAMTIEVVPARIAFPDLDPAIATRANTSDDRPLDGSEPTFEIVLHPLNDVAAAERYAWQSKTRAGSHDVGDGLSTIEQGLEVGCYPWLDARESWRSARYRCHAFSLTATIGGAASVCIDVGYEGKADTKCTVTYNTATIAHPGTNWNPLDEHYFRGRITASVFGVGTTACVYGKLPVCL